MARKITMKPHRSGGNIKNVTTEFIKSCRLKNLSERTIDFYEETISVFTNYIGDEDFTVATVDCNLIEDYILFLKSSGIRSVSINTRIRGIRAFLYWCMQRGYTDEFKIRLIKQEEVIKDTYSDDEIKRLLVKPDIKKCSFTDYRNWVMINFLLGTGIRLSTLKTISIKDIDLETGVFLTVHNKSRKQQMLPLSRTLVKVLIEYISYRKPDSDDNLLFCNQYSCALTNEAINTAIQRYGEKRGVTPCGIHKFRHTFAKNWVLAGGDPFRLQKILGHSSMDIVRKYVNIYGNELQKDYEKFNVLDRLTVDK
ncbi:MAG: site-specific recombinase XerD [Clostridia bacterium]|jgi:integrase/recombinase XerD|nr:site-specific recombinase XerD [Clostridia bacterium]